MLYFGSCFLACPILFFPHSHYLDRSRQSSPSPSVALCPKFFSVQIAIQSLQLLKAKLYKEFSFLGQSEDPLDINYIKEFSFLGQSEDPLDIKKCYVDLNSLQAREDSAIRNEVEYFYNLDSLI
ncbi:hypothetical protein ACB092_06G137800 [Castanea dentata]